MQNETLVRLSVFLGLFVLFGALEAMHPRRPQSRTQRWPTNLGLAVINTVTLRLLAAAVPLLAVGAAMNASDRGWGLFNQVEWPAAAEIVLAVLIFDFAIWVQHLVTHKVPLLWRFHRVHHSDREIDVTTAIRFHPIEIAASMGLKIALIYLIGPSALAIVLFEIILNGTAMFNHANLHLPHRLDAIVRLLLVTPDMHRVHHSTQRHEHDSNYGFALSIWDRIFGTYIPQPDKGHDAMTIGLKWQDDRPAKLGWSLLLPFRKS